LGGGNGKSSNMGVRGWGRGRGGKVEGREEKEGGGEGGNNEKAKGWN